MSPNSGFNNACVELSEGELLVSYAQAQRPIVTMGGNTLVLSECQIHRGIFEIESLVASLDTRSVDQVHSGDYFLKVPLDPLLRAVAEGHLAAIYSELVRSQIADVDILDSEIQSLFRHVAHGAISADRKTISSQCAPKWLEQVCQFIDKNLAENIRICDLADLVWLSHSHLSRMFKRYTGLKVTEYIMSRCIHRAILLLTNTDEGISTIASNCGFESLPHFYRSFKRCTGTAPTEYCQVHCA